MNLGKVGLIGRWKPLHLGGFSLLEAICENSDSPIIGIGSTNNHNLRSPFTADETEEMLRISLSKYQNFRIVGIPDFQNEERWVKYVLSQFGQLDCFVSGNKYVNQLLMPHYKMIHPFEIIPVEKQIEINSTKIRTEMARRGEWKQYVPETVADYLERNHLVERFIKEFGKEAEKEEYKPKLTAAEEKIKVYGK